MFNKGTGVGKMCLVRLGASAFSNVCNSYQIKSLTLVRILSLLLTLLTSFFIPNRTVRLLLLRKMALLALTLTSLNLSPDADLKRNFIHDPVYNVYFDLNCTRRT